MMVKKAPAALVLQSGHKETQFPPFNFLSGDSFFQELFTRVRN